MVVNDVLIVSLAAFLHDVGKMVEDCLEVSSDYLEENRELYQPVSWKGFYTHRHALYTAAFLEQYKQYFPAEIFSKDLGQDSGLNLAAMHHKPETPKQLIISIADRLSSGQDRDEFEEGEHIKIKDYKNTRLVTIFEQLSVQGKKKFSSLADFKWEYELAPVSVESIFPKLRSKEEDGNIAYQTLYNDFVQALSKLIHRNDNLYLWMQHFDSIWFKYSFFVPAARVGKIVPDVSLYHHSKTTSAIATALYLYHLKNNALNVEDIKKDDEKFIIISGDFFGIQKFIFSRGGEEISHRSKLLRGRSFSVSLFCELAADLLCKELQLSPYSVLLNSAGKFYILAPNLPETIEKVKAVEDIINKWLVDISFGETSIGLSLTKGKTQDFLAGNFFYFWQKVQANLQQKKVERFNIHKYLGVFNSYLDAFNNDLEESLCPFCGKRASHLEAENDSLIYKEQKGSACKLCRDHIMLGTNLVKNGRIAVIYDAKDEDLKDKNKCLKEPIFGKYQVSFITGKASDLAKKGLLRKLWKVNPEKNGTIPEEVSFLPLNGYVPVYGQEDNEDERLILGKKSEEKTLELIEAIRDGAPKTFAHIALLSLEKKENHWLGVDALGILKADVDDLGLLFGCGLERNRFTISRLHALSTQLNIFFSFYLYHVLKSSNEFNSFYTVFAGGDDLFLIGPWSKGLSLNQKIYKEFKRYVCENEEIHFSTGFYLSKPHLPIDTIADWAEEYLEEAKDKGKDSIYIFGRVIKHSKIDILLDIEKNIDLLLEKNIISKSFLYKFSEIIMMAEKEKDILRQREVNLKDVYCLKWRSLLHYVLVRNLQEEKEKYITYFVDLVNKHGGDLIIPLWSVLYKHRKYC